MLSASLYDTDMASSSQIHSTYRRRFGSLHPFVALLVFIAGLRGGGGGGGGGGGRPDRGRRLRHRPALGARALTRGGRRGLGVRWETTVTAGQVSKIERQIGGIQITLSVVNQPRHKEQKELINARQMYQNDK